MFLLVFHTSLQHDEWVRHSFSVVQSASGLLMAPILLWMGFFRRTELRKCCETKFVRLYFLLALLGTAIYVYNFASKSYKSTSELASKLVVIEWCSRYVHISLDTMVFLSSTWRSAPGRNLLLETRATVLNRQVVQMTTP
ncbi:unnamed protein product [Choristocarpus tenellus]